jgi:hypothetical protein
MVGDDIQEWWRTPEPQRVLQLMREIGVWRLGNCDGCMCTSFSIRYVDIDVSCGKGRERGVWVSSGSMDYSDTDLLQPIAEEIRRQIEEADGRGPMAVHLHEWVNPSRGSKEGSR